MSSDARTVTADFQTAAVDLVRCRLRTQNNSRWTAVITTAHHLGIHPHSLRIWCDQNGVPATDRTASARKNSDQLHDVPRRERNDEPKPRAPQ